MPLCGSCGTENPDIARFCLACGTPLLAPPPPQEVRKVVTIVFSDLKGSTAMGEKLDSESLREVMTRYFDAMRAELERHGGVIEKFIGDAIMAVFGLPRLHEDDALRAVRAAAAMQRAQENLNDELERRWGVRLTVRTGVNTGEVVAGDPTGGQRLVTGDAVNVAARLEQAAGAQEVLLGHLTYRLVRDYVDVEAVEPLELKGKSERVPAYRLLCVHDDAERPRRLDAPMIGRDAELAELGAALADARRARACRLVTVVGEAGVGKTRLIDEFLRTVESEATITRGRCLPYGDGITYWPLAEAVRSAAGIGERDSADAAREKLATLAGDVEIAERVGAAIGLSQASYPGEELAWGARRLFEALAARRPLVVLFDDIHWAEPTFLELVEHLVAATRNAALVLVATARFDLLERLPDWSTGPGMRRLELARLDEDDTAAVAEHLLGRAGLDERVRARVVQAAEGNPLFVEQLLSMLVDEGRIRNENGVWRPTATLDEIAVPPTIQALLASRIDSLGADERAVIEPASVIGQVFAVDAVRHLAPDRVQPELPLHLSELARKQLVELDAGSADDAYKFQHILIRDTAYEGILKRARATFHEEFVRWADSVNREGATEYEEILGYHLEQAHRYLSELGPLDDHGRALGVDASRRLAAAGRRAFARGDIPAAASLLDRAAALLPEDDPVRLALLPEVGEALLQVGRYDDAAATLDEAIARAERSGAEHTLAHASLVRLLVRLRAGDPERWREEAAKTTDAALAIFEAADDHAGLAKCWRLLAWTHGTSLQFGNAAEASERAIEHARLADDVRQLKLAATAYAAAAAFGPTPVAEVVARCEEIVRLVRGDRQSEATVMAFQGSMLALQGSFAEARRLAGRALSMLDELGLDVTYAHMCLEAWRIELLGGELEAAERVLRDAHARLEAIGEKYLLSTVGGLLGQTLCRLGRDEEAEPFARQAMELATDDDVDTQTLWRSLQGKLLARRGEVAEGERLVREAVALLEPTDALLFHYDALLDLAEVQLAARREEEAGATIAAAIALAERKGSPILAASAERQRAGARSAVLSSD
ncbi:MAG: guanylate cyclase [Gaiellaceae bacterium]|nr:MAG: guanylate cyclase [Gaiellaceae bacterium]